MAAKKGTGSRSEKPRNRGRTQAERTALSHERLLDAALQVFGERGFRNSSLAEIGERAGYSRAMVTLRFGSKEGLLRELSTRMLQVWSAQLLEPLLANMSGVDTLAALLRVHRQSVEGQPQTVRTLYTLMLEALNEMPDLRAGFVKLDEGWRQTIERVVRSTLRELRSPPDVDVKAAATLLLGTLRGVLLQWMLAPDAIDLKRTYRELERWITASLGLPLPSESKGAPAPSRRKRP